MDMLTVCVIFLIGAIVYDRYNTFKVNRKYEEMNRFYMAELVKLKRTVNRRENLN